MKNYDIILTDDSVTPDEAADFIRDQYCGKSNIKLGVIYILRDPYVVYGSLLGGNMEKNCPPLNIHEFSPGSAKILQNYQSIGIKITKSNITNDIIGIVGSFTVKNIIMLSNMIHTMSVHTKKPRYMANAEGLSYVPSDPELIVLKDISSRILDTGRNLYVTIRNLRENHKRKISDTVYFAQFTKDSRYPFFTDLTPYIKDKSG